MHRKYARHSNPSSIDSIALLYDKRVKISNFIPQGSMTQDCTYSMKGFAMTIAITDTSCIFFLVVAPSGTLRMVASLPPVEPHRSEYLSRDQTFFPMAKLSQKLDFQMLQVPSGLALQPMETPNRFLSNIPKLNLEFNDFESKFGQKEEKVLSTPVSANNSANAAVSNTETQSVQQVPAMSLPPSVNSVSPVPAPGAPQVQQPVMNMMPFMQQNMDWQRRASMDVLHEVYPQKRARSNSVQSDKDRSSFLERNRKAAMKCRLKKKHYLMNLENQVESLSKENRQLNQELSRLRKELEQMKQQYEPSN
jgi:hypothetical protein